MSKTMTKTVVDQAQPDRAKIAAYPIQVSRLPDDLGGDFQALYPPLAHTIVGYGVTPADAIEELESLVPSFLEMMARTGQAVPDAPAEKDWDEFSGKFNVRVPRVLHAQLVELAEEQGVSLNSLVQTLLTTGATALAAGNLFGAMRPAPQVSESRPQWQRSLGIKKGDFDEMSQQTLRMWKKAV